jgi:hypothetical protein
MSQATIREDRASRQFRGAKSPSAQTPEPADPLTTRQQARWILAILVVGVVARVVRFALKFPLWEDESFLSANYLDGGYLDMLQPLNYHTVCPVLFSWMQLTAIKLFGFNEYSLRLFSFACGIGSLFLFRHFAGRLLKGTALVLAVAMFAASYPVMRYVAEAKPYCCDLFVSLVMMTLLVEWWRRPGENRWLWLLAAFAPLAIGLSYPAVFVGGGLSLLIAARLWKGTVPVFVSAKTGLSPSMVQEGDSPIFAGAKIGTVPGHGWLPWIAYNVSLVGSFAAVFAVSIRPKLDAQLTTMSSYWLDTFPPIGEPLKLLWWFLETHTGSMLAYPFGGPGFGSTLTFILCAIGVVTFWRRRQFLLLGLTMLPLVLNFVAAALQRYPYGGHMRMTLYLAPMFCILTAVGLAAVLVRNVAFRSAKQTETDGTIPSATERRFRGAKGDRDGLERPSYNRPVAVVLSLLLLVAASSIVRDFWSPYKSSNDLRERAFAQWFWTSASHNGEVVCMHTDLKTHPAPEVFQHGNSAVYLCNQRIYSPRHARGEPWHEERISADWPLRCVQFRSPQIESDEEGTARWLVEMQQKYRLVGKDTYPMPFYNKRENELKFTDYIDVYKFVPL